MASEIKVDTISEKTSAGGVTIDGLLIKDGGISGDVSLIGTTPTFTIGDAGAEDAALVFDGNAQDFYIALDDSADDLVIGLGSTVGTTPAISIDSDLKVNIPVTTASTSTSTGSLITGGGMGVGADLYVGDDTYLITDSAVLGFGADKDTTLTHTDGTGLTLNSTNKLCFNDTGTYVGSNADGDIDVVSDGTAVDSINLESAGGVTLDAGTAGSGVIYEDDGTEMLRIHNSSSNVIVESKVSDKDIIIKGNDGGSTATALTFDMSDKGTMVLGAHGGITFPATQNASSGANTLDDYEEGTWTPDYQGTTGSAGDSNTTVQGAKYTRVGRNVTISTYVSWADKGSWSGDWIISGLPFTSANDNNYHALAIGEASQIGSGGADIGIGLRVQINTDDIWSRELNTGATPVALTVSNFTANGYIIFAGTYQVDT